MRRVSMAVLVVMFVLVLNLSAGDKPSKYKAVEIKHFTGAEGVELTPEFYDFLYAELKNEIVKSKVSEQIVGEGEVIEAADASNAVTVEGSVEEFKRGSVVKAALIGLGTGRQSLRARVKVIRVSDKQAVLEKELTVKFDPRWDNKKLAVQLARKIAGELKKG